MLYRTFCKQFVVYKKNLKRYRKRQMKIENEKQRIFQTDKFNS